MNWFVTSSVPAWFCHLWLKQPTLTLMELLGMWISCFPISHTCACRKLPGKDIKAILISKLLKVKLKIGLRQNISKKIILKLKTALRTISVSTLNAFGCWVFIHKPQQQRKLPSIIFRYYEKKFPAFWPVSAFPSVFNGIPSNPTRHRTCFLRMAKKTQTPKTTTTKKNKPYFFPQRRKKHK